MNIRDSIEFLAQFGGVYAEKNKEEYLHGANFVSGELRVQKLQGADSATYSVWYGNLGKIGETPVYELVVTAERTEIRRYFRGEWEQQLEKETQKRSPALDSSELVAKLV